MVQAMEEFLLAHVRADHANHRRACTEGSALYYLANSSSKSLEAQEFASNIEHRQHDYYFLSKGEIKNAQFVV
jgi:hypothetical protein